MHSRTNDITLGRFPFMYAETQLQKTLHFKLKLVWSSLPIKVGWRNFLADAGLQVQHTYENCYGMQLLFWHFSMVQGRDAGLATRL